MYNTVDNILNPAFIGLGDPEPELMTRPQLAQIVFERLSYYYEMARQSDQNVMVRKSVEFEISSSSDEVDITDLVEDEGYTIITPLWMERRIASNTGFGDVWQYVDNVNTDTITDRRLENIIAVSYYGDNPNQITAKFSVFGDNLVLPYNSFRLWYAPGNVFSDSGDATIQIPPNLGALLVVDVKIQAFAQMQVEAAKYVDDRPGLAARMKAWDRMTMQLETQKWEWTEWWISFTIRSRGYHRAVDHIDVLGQNQALNSGRGG